ncbi:translation initiation factor IF-1 [Gammaproteobacteria bacterium]|jgi:translation initiation factor IF-1|nr:translation initiation factor IF-1 [Gammaproteobacteria bacterium]
MVEEVNNIKAGTVIESFKGSKFKVRLDGGYELEAHISGKMRKYYIRILPGDRVSVEVNHYDPKKGRIISRD